MNAGLGVVHGMDEISIRVQMIGRFSSLLLVWGCAETAGAGQMRGTKTEEPSVASGR